MRTLALVTKRNGCDRRGRRSLPRRIGRIEAVARDADHGIREDISIRVTPGWRGFARRYPFPPALFSKATSAATPARVLKLIEDIKTLRSTMPTGAEEAQRRQRSRPRR